MIGLQVPRGFATDRKRTRLMLRIQVLCNKEYYIIIYSGVHITSSSKENTTTEDNHGVLQGCQGEGAQKSQNSSHNCAIEIVFHVL